MANSKKDTKPEEKETSSVMYALIGAFAGLVLLAGGYILWNAYQTIQEENEAEELANEAMTVDSNLSDTFSSDSQRTPLLESLDSAVIGWKTYESEVLGLTFKYPNGWAVEEDTEVLPLITTDSQGNETESSSTVDFLMVTKGEYYIKISAVPFDEGFSPSICQTDEDLTAPLDLDTYLYYWNTTPFVIGYAGNYTTLKSANPTEDGRTAEHICTDRDLVKNYENTVLGVAIGYLVTPAEDKSMSTYEEMLAILATMEELAE